MTPFEMFLLRLLFLYVGFQIESSKAPKSISVLYLARLTGLEKAKEERVAKQ